MAKIKTKKKLKASSKPKPAFTKVEKFKKSERLMKEKLKEAACLTYKRKSDEFIDNEIESGTPRKSDTPKKKKVKKSKSNGVDKILGETSSTDAPLWGSDEELDEGNSENYESEIKSHKASLDKLKDIDPEFYKFLQENDKKLLDFNVSDSEPDEADEEEKVHKPTGELEVASDESDFEAEDEEQVDTGKQVVTLKMLKKWQADLHTDRTNKTIGNVIQAFHAALLRVSNAEDEVGAFKVDGSSVFNGVIQLCVLELSPAIRKFLGIQSSKVQAHKCKRFVKLKVLLNSYFGDLLKLLGGVTSANILTVLLKHLHSMCPLLYSFPKIMRLTVKKLIHLWGTGEEVVRIVAFLCILRIVTNQMTSTLDTVLKSMYMTYVINSKFVSVNTLSAINFMRRSLTEMFALDPGASYQHVFLYIRQLAIHLRNAIVVHKKENIQTVYNWQFVNSLKLWGSLLAATHERPQLQPLVYPFVQVCLGTMKLVPTAQYYPLRFHIIQTLISFSAQTGVFIPILPFILEVLQDYDFNKKHKKMSMKPLDLTCLLRASNSQMAENGYKDAIIEGVYGFLLEYLSSQSQSMAFPDLTLFCVVQIKQFLKKCANSNYNKKMKQILEKIQQNSAFIERERKAVSFPLTDQAKIAAWEAAVKNKGTPLNTFYESWDKMRTIKKKKAATQNDKLGDYNLPTIKRAKKDRTDRGPANPFPSDSESDDNIKFGDSDEGQSEKTEKKKRRKAREKNRSAQSEDMNGDEDVADEQDIVEDFNIKDW